MRGLERVRAWVRRQRPPKDPSIAVTDDGFSFDSRLGPAHVRWDEVVEIRAWKVDLLTVDEVRFAFQLADHWVEVSEEQPGFTALLRVAERRFPSLRGWQASVLKPAFARNETTLYRRATNAGGSAGGAPRARRSSTKKAQPGSSGAGGERRPPRPRHFPREPSI